MNEYIAEKGRFLRKASRALFRSLQVAYQALSMPLQTARSRHVEKLVILR